MLQYSTVHYTTLHYTTLHYTRLETSCPGYIFLCLFVNYKSFKCVIAAEVLVQIVLVHELKSTQVALDQQPFNSIGPTAF